MLGDFEYIKDMDIFCGQSGMNQRFFEAWLIVATLMYRGLVCKENVHWHEKLVQTVHKWMLKETQMTKSNSLFG